MSNDTETLQNQFIKKEHTDNHSKLYIRKICLYDNLLGWNITGGKLTVKSVLQIDVSDK